MRVPRGSVGVVSAHNRSGDCCPDSGHEAIAQGGQSSRVGSDIRRRTFRGYPGGENSGRVEGSAAQSLLRAAVNERDNWPRPRHSERSHTDGATNFVGRNTEGGEPASREIDGRVTESRDRVEVHGDFGCLCERNNLGDRLNRPHLVVGPECRDEGDVVAQFCREVDEVDSSGLIHTNEVNDCALRLDQPVDGVECRVMFCLRGQDARARQRRADRTGRRSSVTTPEQSFDGEVDRFGAAPRDGDIKRKCTNRRGDLVATLLPHQPRLLPVAVSRGRVSAQMNCARPRVDDGIVHG